MKKVILFSLTMCAMLVFTACGGFSSKDSSNDSGNDKNEYASYREALAANDFEAAHKIIAQAEADLAKCNSASGKRTTLDKAFDAKSDRQILKMEFAEKYGFEASAEDLDKVKEEIFDKEVKFLAANGSPEANDRLVFLFSDFEVKEKKLPVGLNDYYSGDRNQYPSSVNKFNSKLSMVLDLAISQDNKELAQKIIKLFKENMDVFKGGSGHSATDKNGYERYFDIAPDGTEVDGDHCYVTYNWNDKEAAIKKYEETFGSLKETNE